MNLTVIGSSNHHPPPLEVLHLAEVWPEYCYPSKLTNQTEPSDFKKQNWIGKEVNYKKSYLAQEMIESDYLRGYELQTRCKESYEYPDRSQTTKKVDWTFQVCFIFLFFSSFFVITYLSFISRLYLNTNYYFYVIHFKVVCHPPIGKWVCLDLTIFYKIC